MSLAHLPAPLLARLALTCRPQIRSNTCQVRSLGDLQGSWKQAVCRSAGAEDSKGEGKVEEVGAHRTYARMARRLALLLRAPLPSLLPVHTCHGKVLIRCGVAHNQLAAVYCTELGHPGTQSSRCSQGVRRCSPSAGWQGPLPAASLQLHARWLLNQSSSLLARRGVVRASVQRKQHADFSQSGQIVQSAAVIEDLQ